MKIYVDSRGFSQDYDYRWIEVTETEQKRPEELPYILRKTAELIEIDAASVVLARNGSWLADSYLAESIQSIREKGVNREGFKAFKDLLSQDLKAFYNSENRELILLITAIEPSDRRDFIDRQIRISMAWICEASDDNEKLLRWLAIMALEEDNLKSLTREINQAVIFGGEEGFEVDYQAVLQLAESGKIQELLMDEPPDANNVKLGYVSPELKAELVNDLKKYRLPPRESPLVVVTDIQTEDTLIEAQVWRGLSRLVNADGWKVISKSDKATFSNFNNEDRSQHILRVLLSSGISPFLLIVFFWVLWL
ncbi:hypothetical protein [Argonema antarcticum]|uniref:hypothetical protein n=1 Tax=Argonema antarcticum TaxID=2942763 RepID=UPI00201176F6|nr:hypothetical protein [Argonema antarcticum]MCL1471091.1 hypothetical protein [Argonema antarcticum A004/B2]